MAFDFTAKTRCFTMPEDLKEAQAALVKAIQPPYNIWLIGYAFTYQPVIDALIAARKGGSEVHLYLDYSTYTSLDEAPDVKTLVDNGVEVTLGTSISGQRYICHTKGMVVESKTPWCWCGSLNFTMLSWKQANIAHMFNSKPWGANFISEFQKLRDYAWNNEKDIQVLSAVPKGVTILQAQSVFDSKNETPEDYSPLPEF